MMCGESIILYNSLPVTHLMSYGMILLGHLMVIVTSQKLLEMKSDGVIIYQVLWHVIVIWYYEMGNWNSML